MQSATGEGLPPQALVKVQFLNHLNQVERMDRGKGKRERTEFGKLLVLIRG